MVADGAVYVHFDQNRLNRVCVLQIGRRVRRRAQPCKVQRAANEALNDTGIVSRCEELGFDAQSIFGVGAQAFVVVQAILSVFAAQKTDAEFGDGMAVGIWSLWSNMTLLHFGMSGQVEAASDWRQATEMRRCDPSGDYFG